METKEFKSCFFLEKSLIFSPSIIKFCCITQNEQPNPLIYCNYEGGDFPGEKIEEVRTQMREIFNNPEKLNSHYCAKCQHLITKNWSDSKIEEIGISPSDICNLFCSYCRSRENYIDDMKPKYNMLEILKYLIQNDMLTQDCHLVWNGGEPTLLPEFNEALEYVISQGYCNNEVLTNSLNFSQTIYKSCIPNSKFRIVTSVDAGTPETFKTIKKVDAFDRVWENLKKYASNGGNVTVKYIFTDENNTINDVNGFVQNLKDANIKKVFIDINRVYEPDEYDKKFTKNFKLMCKLLAQNEIIVYCGTYCISSAPIFERMQKYYTASIKDVLKKRYLLNKLKFIFTHNKKYQNMYKSYKQWLKNLQNI